ncbi:biopolymer transport protein ExbD [Gimesia maris]|uniref:biopolymer transporter ExbD n=1 Tax=Gimesia maris TaxID=122 RepID=UPI00118B49B5|nr:biopolymer transporter ExbD [Gimesia maris]QDT79843.1 biopolymer transport protein ExbD [Gimesia maris]
MPIKFYCKKCGQRLSITSKRAGKAVACPACRSRIIIPFESEDKRTDPPTTAPAAEEPPVPPRKKHPETVPTPAADTPLDEEQDQLLHDLDDLGPIGESWDELLAGDWEQEPESFPQPEPVVSDELKEPEPPVEEESPQLESSPVEFFEEEVEQVEEVDDTFAAEPEPEPVAESEPAVSPEVMDPKIPLESVPEAVSSEIVPEPEESAVPPIASTETAPETATAVKKYFPPEEDEDDEDDDDGFSIRSADSEFEEMDLTPMVDVTFLLLIFFMITASFSLQKSIQVPPPNPDEDGVSQSLQTLDDFREESIIVEIDNNNGIYVDDTKLSNPAEIVQAILDRRDADGKPKSELVLSAHKAARHETVVAVVDAANEVGMQKIRLASYKGPED